jgi:hypothetical protein
VQLIDFHWAFGVLELPHPLLSYDEYLRGGLGRAGVPDKEARPPQESEGADAQGDDGPEHFQWETAFHLSGLILLRTPPVSDGEIEDGEKNERGEKQIDRGQEVVKMINATRDGGGLIGPYGEPLPHSV